MELQLLPRDENNLRLSHIRMAMESVGADAILISDNANKYYLTGRVFAGFIYIPAQGEAIYFVKRPNNLKGDFVVHISKPEKMAESLSLDMPAKLGLELDLMSWSEAERIKKVFPASVFINASALLRQVRAVKTKLEIEKIRLSGVRQEHVYRMIPRLYIKGMTDLEFQVAIENASRLEGCLGQFRISGNSMELYMGSVISGDNADTPAPYDFAMGGGGLDPSLPVGCNGSLIETGQCVMVDVNGNYTGYMTDMTRTFRLGEVEELAIKAHQTSIDICNRLTSAFKPGDEAKAMYEEAERIALQRGLHDYFMGHKQKAGFIGHGVGIEINELPVIAPRSRDILAPGNVIALEPKFVIPRVGAVGVENTYVLTERGFECLTKAPEEMIDLI